MFAEIYRDFAGKSECKDFKTGIPCIPAIPVIFEVNQKKVRTLFVYSLLRFFKFPYNFCRDFRHNVIPVIITCTLQGIFCNTGIPRTFYGGKICSVCIYATSKTFLPHHLCGPSCTLLECYNPIRLNPLSWKVLTHATLNLYIALLMHLKLH